MNVANILPGSSRALQFTCHCAVPMKTYHGISHTAVMQHPSALQGALLSYHEQQKEDWAKEMKAGGI